jgi:hypothetical protein
VCGERGCKGVSTNRVHLIFKITFIDNTLDTFGGTIADWLITCVAVRHFCTVKGYYIILYYRFDNI